MTCNVGALAQVQSATITLVTNPLSSSPLFTNTATVTTITPDGNITNNQSSVTWK